MKENPHFRHSREAAVLAPLAEGVVFSLKAGRVLATPITAIAGIIDSSIRNTTRAFIEQLGETMAGERF